jgi:hypothetical protein
MGLFLQRRGVRIARKIFRWCRITVWFAIFLAVVAVAYLHLVGLPNYLKTPLLAKMRRRGVEARFTEARLGWGPAIVVENVAFSPTNSPAGPHVSARLMEMQLNLRALLRGGIRVDSVELSDGQVRVPVAKRYGKELRVDALNFKLRLLPHDTAQLTDCHASVLGVKVDVHGRVTSFSQLRNWKLPSRERETAAPETNQNPALNILQRLHFANHSTLDIDFSADGRKMDSLRAEAALKSPGVETPWGVANGLRLRTAAARLLNATNRPIMRLTFIADSVTTRWGKCKNPTCTAGFFPEPGSLTNASLSFAGNDLTARVGTNVLRAKHISWNASAALSPTNFRPSGMSGEFRLAGAVSQWGSAGGVRVVADIERTNVIADDSLGIWKRFFPYIGSFRVSVTNLDSPKLQLKSVAVAGQWRTPQLSIQTFDARLYDGHVGGSADLNVASREAHCHANSDFDPKRIMQFLTPAAQKWIGEYEWESPPKVNAEIRSIFPPWENNGAQEGDSVANLRDNFRKSIQIAGNFEAKRASFRGFEFESASAHFFYTNRVWQVPDLHAARAEGVADVDYTGNEATHQFRAAFVSHLDPIDAIPLLKPPEQKILRDATFQTPPEIRGELSGFWHEPQSFAFNGTIVASNFTARGESVDRLSASVSYTNKVLVARDVQLAQGKGRALVPFASADFVSKRIEVTNAESTMDPAILRRQFGTKFLGFLGVVHFDAPPSVRASGSFVLGNPLATDMRFYVRGNNFHWTNIGADKITGTVFWTARSVTLTNIDAHLYNAGTLNGWLAFDYVPKRGSSFRSDFVAKNVDLGLLAQSLTGKKSKVEGMLDGSLLLSAPMTTNRHTWTGRGYVNVHDALLWQIKIFGVFSPVLNALAPGAGDSRARSASANFTIGNGEVSSDNLEVHATAMRLLYKGSISMDKHINGRVEADLLRDTPLLGGVFSLVLSPLSKIFEYEIKGPLRDPVIKPLYIPKFLMMLLRPFHTIKSALPEIPSPPPKTNKQP